jgi:hypothetical protein
MSCDCGKIRLRQRRQQTVSQAIADGREHAGLLFGKSPHAPVEQLRSATISGPGSIELIWINGRFFFLQSASRPT